MNEAMIFQSMSSLVFNAMARGEDRELAMQRAEELLRKIALKSKALAAELNEEVEPTSD